MAVLIWTQILALCAACSFSEGVLPCQCPSTPSEWVLLATLEICGISSCSEGKWRVSGQPFVSTVKSFMLKILLYGARTTMGSNNLIPGYITKESEYYSGLCACMSVVVLFT